MNDVRVGDSKESRKGTSVWWQVKTFRQVDKSDMITVIKSASW